MEIRPAGRKPEMRQLQLDNGATIQQALEKAGLVKRFRRMNIEVMRVTGEQRAKLDAKYDHTKAQVNPLYDYALHPGDHLIVAQDTATTLDDMLESISPLRQAAGL
jgi:protein involved in polysaccharide export with SLBB domain